MKVSRHAKIVELIGQYDVETQEELAELLNREGFQVTQATVSRDIRDLKLTKVQTEKGKQKYQAIEKAARRTRSPRAYTLSRLPKSVYPICSELSTVRTRVFYRKMCCKNSESRETRRGIIPGRSNSRLRTGGIGI